MFLSEVPMDKLHFPKDLVTLCSDLHVFRYYLLLIGDAALFRFNHFPRAFHALPRLDVVDLDPLWFDPQAHECHPLLDHTSDPSSKILDCKSEMDNNQKSKSEMVYEE